MIVEDWALGGLVYRSILGCLLKHISYGLCIIHIIVITRLTFLEPTSSLIQQPNSLLPCIPSTTNSSPNSICTPLLRLLPVYPASTTATTTTLALRINCDAILRILLVFLLLVGDLLPDHI